MITIELVDTGPLDGTLIAIPDDTPPIEYRIPSVQYEPWWKAVDTGKPNVSSGDLQTLWNMIAKIDHEIVTKVIVFYFTGRISRDGAYIYQRRKHDP